MMVIQEFTTIQNKQRYRIADSKTGRIIDDCQGYGFSTLEKAYNASCLFGIEKSNIQLSNDLNASVALF